MAAAISSVTRFEVGESTEHHSLLLLQGRTARELVPLAVEVGAHRAEALAEQLAGWTDAAEVIEPAAVRVELRRLGERMVETYGDP